MNVSWSPPVFGEEEKKAAIDVINAGWVTQGKETEKFEKEICDYIGCKHAVAVNSGTSALVAALLAHGIGQGDEVIMPSFTFIATINSVLSVGAKPVLVDIDKKTWNTTPELVEEKITANTKAIMPVDVAGLPCDIGGFMDLAEEKNMAFIADSAESMGAKYKDKLVGSFDNTSIFSFHIAKQVSTIEGGCIVTNDEMIYEKCMSIRNHGMAPNQGKNFNYIYDHFGLNFRIDDIRSAIGRVQLKKVEETIKHRNKLASYYKKELGGLYGFQEIPPYVTRHPYMFFGLLTLADKRDSLITDLNKKGISTRVTWLPAHMQNYHKDLFNINLPNTEDIYSSIISLPMGNNSSMKEIEHVVKNLKGDKDV